MKQFILVFMLITGACSLKASHPEVRSISDSLNDSELVSLEPIVIVFDSVEQAQKPVKFKRGKAIIFTILTGLLGGHRIYLGTHHRTPIIYSVTLGGLGILPLVDLINLIFTKDISKFEHKSQIIMWGK